MKIEKREMSLFDTTNDYALAHCISADFGMSGGIVLMFNKLYDMKNILQTKHEDLSKYFITGFSLKEEVKGRTIYNLITKKFVHESPTYLTLANALEDMKIDMLDSGIKKLAIPLIGCGIDGLKWRIVENIIEQMFVNTDIEILVCYLEKDKYLLEK